MALAAIGAVFSLVCIGIAAGALRSERSPRDGGRLRQLRRLGARDRQAASDTDLAAVIVASGGTIDTVRQVGSRLLVVILLKFLADAACLIVALGAYGVPSDALTIAGAFAAYSLCASAGHGDHSRRHQVVEVAYIAALDYVTQDAYHTEIVAGVLLFRVITYIAPIPAGAVAYVFGA